MLLSRIMRLSLLLSTVLTAGPGPAQTAAGERPLPGRVLLVLPFDNRSGQANLAWIGDSFPDTLNARLASAGFLPITRDDRQFALDHLGLPPNFRPTRATTLRIAQTLDADYVVVGSFTLINGRIQVQAQVLAVKDLRLSAPLEDSAELARLFDIENAVAWKVARQIDPGFPVAQQTFLSASSGVQLTAFENYIRGTDAATPTERVRHLEAAVKDAPNYAAALLALGKEQYADRQYDAAAATLAKMPQADRLALEANFFLGLARFNTTRYADAETAFGFVATRLPLPEVVNDQGVAAARQGKDATGLFQRAVNADPNDADYRFNLAVAHFRRGDFAGAQRENEAALKLRPADTEAAGLRTLIAAGRATTAAAKPSPSGFEPAERLRRTYSEASFRQAAFQLDQVRALRLSTLSPAQQAAEYTQLGRDFLNQGLLPEAEGEFHAALNADPHSVPAHLGLARVRESSGDRDAARSEAQAALTAGPNADAYLLLARLDLGKNDLPAAAGEVRRALALEPANATALALKQTLANRGQALP